MKFFGLMLIISSVIASSQNLAKSPRKHIYDDFDEESFFFGGEPEYEMDEEGEFDESTIVEDIKIKPVLQFLNSLNKTKIDSDPKLNDIYQKMTMIVLENIQNPNFDLEMFLELSAGLEGAPDFKNLK